MITKLKDIPYPFGHIDGEDIEADILVRVTTDPEMRADVEKLLKEDAENGEKTFSLDKTYHIHKITGYGDVADVWITNDLGEEEELCNWIFEDIDD